MGPANRLGYRQFTGYQLKTIQEIITLVVLVGFASLVLGESSAGITPSAIFGSPSRLFCFRIQ
jgi:uncharacterized protein (DUF486 family)